MLQARPILVGPAVREAGEARMETMPKGPRGERRPADVVGCAVAVAKIATGEIKDTRLVQPNKRKAGVAGGKARKEAVSPERRREIAKAASAARWSG